MRFNPIYDTWVAIAEKRQARPTDYCESMMKPNSSQKIHHEFCPFCEGNEFSTPSEVDVMPMPQEVTLDNYRRPNAPGWMVRAVPNRFPFLEPNQERVVQKFGPYLMASNVGKQEVLIDVPFHNTKLGALTPEEFQYLIHFYHRRLHQVRKEGRWHYAQLFKNQGVGAGASLQHLHSQLVVLPFVPPSIKKEQDYLAHYTQKNGKCYHCDVLQYELQEPWRFVLETEYFVVLCPFASRYAGEVHIMPKRHVPCFVQATREELDNLSFVMREVIQKIDRATQGGDFNLVLRTSPWEYSAEGVQLDPNFHWRFEICPRLTYQAGFELGTGCFVNPISPERFARELRAL